MGKGNEMYCPLLISPLVSLDCNFVAPLLLSLEYSLSEFFVRYFQRLYNVPHWNPKIRYKFIPELIFTSLLLTTIYLLINCRYLPRTYR